MFKQQQHLGIKAAVAFKKCLMIFAPSRQICVFALCKRGRFAYITKPYLFKTNCACHQRGNIIPIGCDIATAQFGHGLGLCLEIGQGIARCRFRPRPHQRVEPVTHLGAIPKLECTCPGIDVLQIFHLFGHLLSPPCRLGWSRLAKP